MSGENAELVSRLARRIAEPAPEPQLPITGELNAPIDTVQADCLSLRALIRGWIADAKQEVAAWQPRPAPPR